MQSSKKKSNVIEKEDSDKEAASAQTIGPVNKTVLKNFSFGQNKTKTFSAESDWHTRGKQTTHDSQNNQNALKMNELMETLPD